MNQQEFNKAVEADIQALMHTKQAATITVYDAISIIEGDIESTEEEALAAWQHLLDTGVVWRLQGYYQRQIHALVDAGLVEVR